MSKLAGSSRLPDFYGIGAPRCGTTTIFQLLQRQPSAFVPVKEPRYWCDDLDSGSAADSLFFTRTFDEYVALYAAARPDDVVGDMSTWYLMSRTAVPRIVRATPGARFIVGVRNPVDLMQSLHAWRVAGLSEDIVDFRAALAAEDERLCGQRITRNVRNRSGLFYRRVASLGEQLQRLAAHVPMDQIHVYVYDDFREDPLGTLNSLLEFLCLQPLAPEDDIPIVNLRPSVSRLSLRTSLMSPPTVIWARRFVPAPIRRTARHLLDAVTLGRETRASAPKIGLSGTERRDLLESFRADIELVSEFTRRDMWALWSRPDPS